MLLAGRCEGNFRPRGGVGAPSFLEIYWILLILKKPACSDRGVKNVLQCAPGGTLPPRSVSLHCIPPSLCLRHAKIQGKCSCHAGHAVDTLCRVHCAIKKMTLWV